MREGLHTTLADMRKMGREGWRAVCPETSIFILGRERAKLGYFWKHAYLKGRSGKHLGLVVNPDTHKPISTDDEFLDVRDFDKKRLHEMVEREKNGTHFTLRSGRPTATRSSAWRLPTTWAATCRSGSTMPLLTKSTNWQGTPRKAMRWVFSPESAKRVAGLTGTLSQRLCRRPLQHPVPGRCQTHGA